MEFIPLDRNYTTFENIIPSTYNISDNKLLVGDIIGDEIIYKSKYRNTIIHGIIILNSTTHGRKGKKIYYKFVPFQKNLPIFIVPYQIKKQFIKMNVNKYASIQFHNWENKHPEGELKEIIGDVDNNDAFCQYLVNCHNLKFSLREINNNVKKNISSFLSIDDFISHLSNKHPIQDRTQHDIISIDPAGCKDIDDAVGLTYSDNTTILSIYIANVPIIIDALLLWNRLNDNYSSIYLSDKKRPMLPTIISENICSLLENKNRFAMALDIYILDNTIINQVFKPCVINVRKNYSYEDNLLNADNLYYAIKHCVCDIEVFKKQYKTINDSHYLIELLMVYMNKAAATVLKDEYNPIYKALQNKNNIDKIIPDDISNLMNNWGGFGSFYTYDTLTHDNLDCKLYAQITSPIRRFVDLINMTYINKLCNIKLEHEFHNINLDKLNKQVKDIKKIETQTILLSLCSSTDFLNKNHDGYIIEIMDGKVIVYLINVKKIIKVKTDKIFSLFQKIKCKLYFLNYEHNLNKKIRANIID